MKKRKITQNMEVHFPKDNYPQKYQEPEAREYMSVYEFDIPTDKGLNISELEECLKKNLY